MANKLLTSATQQSIFANIDSKGKVFVLAMTYTESKPGKEPWTSARIPAETVKKGEKSSDALIRGIREEVADPEYRADFTVARGSFWFAQTKDDEDNPNGFHAKIAIAVNQVSGKVRSVPKKDDDDPHELHGPIERIEIEELMKQGIRGFKLISSHYISLQAYLEHLSVRKPEVARRYGRHLEYNPHKHRITTMTEWERNQVAEYIAG